ncbi:MAG: DUF2283 domain-containing protein [Nanoarchaeota archaeon]
MEEAWYDKNEDILDIELKRGEYWKTVELPNGVNIDIAKDGSIISIEILSASKAFSGEARIVLEKAKAAAVA